MRNEWPKEWFDSVDELQNVYILESNKFAMITKYEK